MELECHGVVLGSPFPAKSLKMMIKTLSQKISMIKNARLRWKNLKKGKKTKDRMGRGFIMRGMVIIKSMFLSFLSRLSLDYRVEDDCLCIR